MNDSAIQKSQQVFVCARTSISCDGTIYREHGFRFYFFSREESRMHVHISHASGEAKFWLQPDIELAKNIRLNPAQLKQVEESIRRHQREVDAWQQYFNR